eukprot:COSAG01_NODE_568_length_15370_cov_26.058018_5_plen_109_part_00
MTNIEEITCQELKHKLANQDPFILIDVREQDEHDLCHLKEAQLIPLQSLATAYETLDPEQDIIVMCKMGGRSANACEFLKQKGFKQVKNLVGGIRQWAEEIDPSMPVY